MSIENQVRLYLAISIDSVGYTEIYRRIGERTGLTICEVNRGMNLQLDNEKGYRRAYRKQDRNKIRQMRRFYQKLTVRKRKLTADNRKGLQYASGMMGPFQEDGTDQPTGGTIQGKDKRARLSKEQQKNQVCGHCFRLGHSR
jgi:hypothetical protein